MTRVLVTTASQFGSTRRIGQRIGEALRRHGIDVDVRDAAEAIDASGYDGFVIGSAVHGGHWLKPATAFVRRHQPVLARHPVWLFSSGPVGDRAVSAPQPDPYEIREFQASVLPVEHRVLAGSFDRSTADFRGLGLIERTVVKQFLPEGDWRDWDAIDAWAATIAQVVLRDLRPVLAG